jgi:hypothetical protein
MPENYLIFRLNLAVGTERRTTTCLFFFIFMSSLPKVFNFFVHDFPFSFNKFYTFI